MASFSPRLKRPALRERKILDIYVMSFITKIDIEELYQIWTETGRELGDFETYKTRSPSWVNLIIK